MPNQIKMEVWDAEASLAVTLELLSQESDRRVLVVRRCPERPIKELVFCHRRCNQNPPEDIMMMVRALSMTHGSRSFSGDSCRNGVYVGNNIWGRGFEKRSTYCQHCGYAMEGPEIHHVEIVTSDNHAWNQAMIAQCEIGAYWDEGKNIGITYEMI